jgi:hypothetical protein
MKRFKTATALLALAAVLGTSLPYTASAKVVRPAPNFTVSEVGGSLAKSFKGQPVIVVFASSPRNGSFKKQVKLLEKQYRYFAGRDVVCVAVFSSEPGQVKSDIPFITADDGAGVASAYGVTPGKFGLAIIGPDGNLDKITSDVTSGQGVLSIIENTYEVQAAAQKQAGG